MLSLRTGILAQLVVISLCSLAPPAAFAQGSGAPVADATLEFLPDQNDPAALKCDALADHPRDPHRVGDGVVFEQISVADALPVCERAATQPPARPRYQYLYGRVLDADGNQAEAAARQFTLANEAGPSSEAWCIPYQVAGTTPRIDSMPRRTMMAGSVSQYAGLSSSRLQGPS
jgi:hypothetical protein